MSKLTRIFAKYRKSSSDSDGEQTGAVATPYTPMDMPPSTEQYCLSKSEVLQVINAGKHGHNAWCSTETATPAGSYRHQPVCNCEKPLLDGLRKLQRKKLRELSDGKA